MDLNREFLKIIEMNDMLLSLSPQMKLSVAGVLIDAASTDLNQSVEKTYKDLMKVSTEINAEMGAFAYD